MKRITALLALCFIGSFTFGSTTICRMNCYWGPGGMYICQLVCEEWGDETPPNTDPDGGGSGGGSGTTHTPTETDADGDGWSDCWKSVAPAWTGTYFTLNEDQYVGVNWGGENENRPYHNGVDLPVSTGSRVNTAGFGTVAYAGYNGDSGNVVYVNHPDGTQTRYAHLSSISVSQGQEVQAGTQLGQSGSTGSSTGPHLHFGLKPSQGGSQYLDPTQSGKLGGPDC